MTLGEKQAAWREKYLAIPDVQDRLAALLDRKSRLEPLREEERNDGNLVPGCVSRVWLVAERREGVVRVRVEAEASLVSALAAFLGEFYDGEMGEEAAAFETTLLDDLGISRMLSPTREQGLRKIGERIRMLAAGA